MVNLSTELYNLFDSDGSHIVTFLDWLAKLYQLSPPVQILDVGCGTGRTLEHMALQGWQIVGLEPHQDYYESAQKVSEEYENVTVIRGGFADIDTQNMYDMTVAVNAPFAYLLTIEERVDALQRIHRALKYDGVVFLDIPNFLHLLKNYRNPEPSLSQSPTGDVIQRVVEYDVDYHKGIFSHTDIFYVNNTLTDKQIHHMAIMTLTELIYLLRQVGFAEIRTFNGFGARESQTIQGMRLMVSARKTS